MLGFLRTDPRSIKSLAWALITLMGWAGAASAAVQVIGPATTERVSGTRNSDRVVTIGRVDGAAPLALKRIEWGERKDNPCWFKVTIGDMRQVMLPPASNRDQVDRCANKGPTQRSKRELGYGTGKKYDYTRLTTEPVYITGIRVCLNRKGTRIKGIQIEGKRVKPRAPNILQDLEAVDGAINAPRISHQNCDGKWRRWSRCGRNKAAVAVDVHFEAGPEPRSGTGLAVRCRAVAGENALVRPTR